MANFGEFYKPESCGQAVLPDRSLFNDKIGRKGHNSYVTLLVIFKHFGSEYLKKCDIFADFSRL